MLLNLLMKQNALTCKCHSMNERKSIELCACLAAYLALGEVVQ